MSDKINLVIVESGGKVATISKYLNNIPELKKYGKFIVAASVGHVLSLQKKNGVEVDNNFKMNYVISDDKVKVVNNLKKLAKTANMVFLASDLDLEGEFIAYSLRMVLNLKKYYRVTFNEITKESMKQAFLNPGQIDNNKVESQESRRALDRLLGYKMTGCLWKSFTTQKMVSAGRVQSACLKIMVDNEKVIDKFVSESYYKLSGGFGIDKVLIEEANLYNGTTILKIIDKKKTIELITLLVKNEKKFFIKDINNKTINEKPSLPFITSSLQQEGSSKLHMSVKQVMSTAQKLYEGGHITYMRTDSYNISETAHNDIQNYIIKTYGENHYKRRAVTKKVKGSQEAHEAIRCTDISKDTVNMSTEHQKLYDMIRKRTIASQMIDAVYQEGSVSIGNKSLPTDTYFLGKAKVLINPGYLIVYSVVPEKIDVNKWLNDIKKSKNIILNNLEGHNTWSVPHQRFSEATIIKKMETENIGRPSTYAATIAKLFERDYIVKKDVFGEKVDYVHYQYSRSTKKLIEVKEKKELYTEKSKLVPTENGIVIADFLEKYFSEIVNVHFTSEIEEKLDEIADAKLTKLKFLTLFYKNFMTILDKVKIEKSDKVDLKNNSFKNEFMIGKINYIIREAKYGPVIETIIDEKKEYINIKAYLAIVKKNIEDINETDIKYIIQFPKNIGKINGNIVSLVIGPYGFYLKHNDKNIKIPYAIKNTILNMRNYESLLEYV
jgi:DNA topoisomerase-1